jgi:hypothetical protein
MPKRVRRHVANGFLFGDVFQTSLEYLLLGPLPPLYQTRVRYAHLSILVLENQAVSRSSVQSSTRRSPVHISPSDFTSLVRLLTYIYSCSLKVYMTLFPLLHRTSYPVQQVPTPPATKVSQAKKGYPSPGRQ